MISNLTQFCFYSIDIFNQLYDKFPVTTRIDADNIIQHYIEVVESEDIKQLKTSIDMADLVTWVSTISDNDGLTPEQEKRTNNKIKKLETFERDKKQEKELLNSIFLGTVTFLKEEGFIRELDGYEFQLTIKGFSHLNKQFKNKEILKEPATYIATIKSLFSLSGSISSGVSVNIITEMLTK